MNSRSRLTALTALVFTFSLAAPAEATQGDADGADAVAVAIESASSDQVCAYVQATTITLDGDSTTYTLGTEGQLIESAPDVIAEDCVPAEAADTAARAATPIGDKNFTSGSPSFSASDTNGTFTAQVSYATTGLAWGYRVAGSLTTIATGPANATVVRTLPNCAYAKTAVGAGYPFHGSCPSHSFGTPYSLTGGISFPIQVAGNSGTATISWVFNYRVSSL